MCVLHKLPLGTADPFLSPRVGCCPPPLAPSHPYFFLATHFLSFSPSLSCRHTVFNNDVTGIIRDTGRGVSAVKSGASQRRSKRSVRRR